MKLSVFWSGVVALTVWGGAFNIENFRGGFLAVAKGLREAAYSLGLTRLQYLLLVALPLGLRVSIPSVLNTSISMLKNSAYLQAIGLAELTFVAMDRLSTDFRTLEMFASIGLHLSRAGARAVLAVRRHRAGAAAPVPTGVSSMTLLVEQCRLIALGLWSHARAGAVTLVLRDRRVGPVGLMSVARRACARLAALSTSSSGATSRCS